jgi:hypothetical protein
LLSRVRHSVISVITPTAIHTGIVHKPNSANGGISSSPIFIARIQSPAQLHVSQLDLFRVVRCPGIDFLGESLGFDRMARCPCLAGCS